MLSFFLHALYVCVAHATQAKLKQFINANDPLPEALPLAARIYGRLGLLLLRIHFANAASSISLDASASMVNTQSASVAVNS